MGDLFSFNTGIEPERQESDLFSFQPDPVEPIDPAGSPRKENLPEKKEDTPDLSKVKPPRQTPLQEIHGKRREQKIQNKDIPMSGRIYDMLGIRKDIDDLSDLIFQEGEDTRDAEAKNIYALSQMMDMSVEQTIENKDAIYAEMGFDRDVSTEELTAGVFVGGLTIASGMSIMPAGAILFPSILKGVASFKAISEGYDLAHSVVMGSDYKFWEDRNIIKDVTGIDTSNRLVRDIVTISDMVLKGYGIGKVNQAGKFLKGLFNKTPKPPMPAGQKALPEAEFVYGDEFKMTKADRMYGDNWRSKKIPDLYVPKEYFKEAPKSIENTGFKDSLLPAKTSGIMKVDLSKQIPKGAIPWLRLQEDVDLRTLEQKLAETEQKLTGKKRKDKALPRAKQPSDVNVVRLNVDSPLNDQLDFYRIPYREKIKQLKKLFDFRDPKTTEHEMFKGKGEYKEEPNITAEQQVEGELRLIIEEVRISEAGSKKHRVEEGGTYDAEAGERIVTPSTFPEWFQNRGWTKKEFIKAVENGIAGKIKPNSVKQQQMFDVAMVEAENARIEHLEEASQNEEFLAELTPDEITQVSEKLDDAGLEPLPDWVTEEAELEFIRNTRADQFAEMASEGVVPEKAVDQKIFKVETDGSTAYDIEQMKKDAKSTDFTFTPPPQGVQTDLFDIPKPAPTSTQILDLQNTAIPPQRIGEVLDFAEALGVKIATVTFVDEPRFADLNNPDDIVSLKQHGFTDKEIQDGKENKARFRIEAEHGLVADNNGKFRGSALALFEGHTEISLYHEVSHAIAEQGGIPNWAGTKEQQADYLAQVFKDGTEGDILELTQAGKRVGTNVPWGDGTVLKSVKLEGSNAEITAKTGAMLVPAKGIVRTPKADTPVKRLSEMKGKKLADLIPNGIINTKAPSSTVLHGKYKGYSENWKNADLIAKAMREGKVDTVDVGGDIFFIPKGKEFIGVPAYRYDNPIKETNNKVKAYIFDVPAVYACQNCKFCHGTCYAVGAQIMFPETKLGRFANLYMFLNHRADLRARIDKSLISGKYDATRIHTSGDFFSQPYVDFIEGIIKDYPKMKFYSYSKAEGIKYNKIDKLKNFNRVESVLPDGSINYGSEQYINRQAKAFGIKKCPASIRKAKYTADIKTAKANKVPPSEIGKIRLDFKDPDKAIVCGTKAYVGRGKKCALCMDKKNKHMLFLEQDQKNNVGTSEDWLEEIRDTNFGDQIKYRSIKKEPPATPEQKYTEGLKVESGKIKRGEKVQESLFSEENTFEQNEKIVKAEKAYLQKQTNKKGATLKQTIRTVIGNTTNKADLAYAEDRVLSEYLKNEILISKQAHEGKRVTNKLHKENKVKIEALKKELSLVVDTEKKLLRDQIRSEAKLSRVAYKAGEVDKALEHKEKQEALMAIAYMRKLAKQINADIPLNVDRRLVPQIEELIKDIDTGFHSDKKLQERTQTLDYLARNPEHTEKMPQKILTDIVKQPLENYTIPELEAVLAERKAIIEKGQKEYKIREGARKAADHAIVRKAVDNIMGTGGGVTRPPVTKAELAQRKNWLQIGATSVLRPWALFNFVDGYKGFEGTIFEYFFNKTNDYYDQYLRFVKVREQKMRKTFDDLGITEKEITQKWNMDGSPFSIDEMMGVYGLRKNLFGLHTITFGNRIALTTQEKIVNFLEPKYKKLADAVMEDYAEHLPRLADAYLRNTNQILVVEKYYLPLMTKLLSDLGQTESITLDADIRRFLKAMVDKGMTLDRVKLPAVFEKGVKLGIVEQHQTQVKKHEHYIWMSPHIRSLQNVIEHPDLKLAVQQTKRWVTVEHLKQIKENINRTANNQFYRSHNPLAEGVRFLRQSQALHYLVGGVPSMLRQFPSVLMYAPFSGWGNLYESIKYISTPPPMKTITVKGKEIQFPDFAKGNLVRVWDMVRHLDPQVYYRMQEVVMDEISGLNGNQIMELRKKVGHYGLAGIRMIDGVAITVGWYATFIANLDKGVDYAVKQARNATLMTQPQSHPKDVSGIFDTGQEQFNWLMQFGTQLNQFFSLYTHQLIDAIKNDDPSRFFATIIAGIFGSLMIWTINNQRLPSDAEDVKDSITDHLKSTTPVVGKAMLQIEKGYDSNGVNALKGFDMLYKNFTENEGILDTSMEVLDALGLMSGLYPNSANRIGNAIQYLDPMELMGEPPE